MTKLPKALPNRAFQLLHDAAGEPYLRRAEIWVWTALILPLLHFACEQQLVVRCGKGHMCIWLVSACPHALLHFWCTHAWVPCRTQTRDVVGCCKTTSFRALPKMRSNPSLTILVFSVLAHLLAPHVAACPLQCCAHEVSLRMDPLLGGIPLFQVKMCQQTVILMSLF